jgi:transcriptional regulator with XRE-family HTH domain
VLFSRRITYVQAAKACHYSTSYVDQVLNGRVPASAEFVRRMATFLGLPPDQLFVLDEEAEKPRSVAPRSTRRRVTPMPRRLA